MDDAFALVDQAAAWADEHKCAVKVPNDVEMNDKWPARSALQKAIRRGEHDEALSQAARLWKCDADYTWRALATVAIEDVGFGDPEAVLYAHLGQLKTFRAKLDDGRLLTALVAQMCEAPKTRSCCELSIAMDWGHESHIKKMVGWSAERLIEVVKAEDIGESYGALRVLRGRVPEGEKRGKDDGSLGIVEQHMMETLPEPFGLAAIHALRRPVDSMSLAFFQTTRLFLEVVAADGVEIVEDVFPPSERVGKFFSEAWDMHTQTGKKALKAFHTSLSKDYAAIKAIPKEKAVKALGAAVFVEEGGLVDRRILGGELFELQQVQDETFLPVYGVPKKLYEEVRQIVRKEIERLNSKRLWALKLGEPW